MKFGIVSSRRWSSRTDRRRRAWRLPVELLEGRLLLSNTYTVTNSQDGGNTGSLRWAIEQVDGDSTDSAASPDQIAFDLPTSDPGYAAGVWTIAPASALPALSRPVVIDGYTQAGAQPNTNGPGLADNAVLTIVLSGADVGTGADGLQLLAGANGSTVQGLAINGFTASTGGNAVEVDGQDDTIAGDFLGTNAGGTASVSNNLGVWIHSTSVDADDGNTIGGIADASRNVISGNNDWGILITGGGGDTVLGNFIGTDSNGTHALPGGTSNTGIELYASSSSTIGGTANGAGNVISGNAGYGLYITNNGTGVVALTDNNVVEGNLIGTDLTGDGPLGNGSDDVALLGDYYAVSGNTIGGTSAAARNVIAASQNGSGVSIDGADPASVYNNVVAGNAIGTDATGMIALGNAHNGISVEQQVYAVQDYANNPGNVITNNVIADNLQDGVNVQLNGLPSPDDGPLQGTAILANSIYGNGGLGINLVGGSENSYGVTANSPGGPNEDEAYAGLPLTHFGPNELQNYPVLLSATVANGTTTITGLLNSAPDASYTIEFFANPTADPSGHGQGQTFLGRLTNVTTAGDGTSYPFTLTVPRSLAGQSITATATDANQDTSEFAADLQATATAPGPAADLNVSFVSSTPKLAAWPLYPNGLLVAPGSLTWTFQVTNHGPDAATGVTITGATYPGEQLSASLGTITVSGSSFTDNVGDLAVGQSLTITYSGNPTEAGNFTDTLQAHADQSQPIAYDATASFSFGVLVPPEVVSVQRFGYHAQPTTLVLTFSQPMTLGPTQDVSTYDLVPLIGRSNRAGRPIPIVSAVYNAATDSVTLKPARRLSLNQRYELTTAEFAGGLIGTSGIELDGSGTGFPGSPFSTVIDRATLAGPAPSARTIPRRAPHPAAVHPRAEVRR